ncbi:mannosyl-3-phosphoglycerate phosphatase [Litorivivens lipolytica]|uniref:Mannosyl-3-phosphoglycerate phosphatase n=1 Tax=Litorivivens lipolytica TaxID=1524264 RepID=A0A7W4W1N1_9GAMM|nr:HAD-IIB family hydrolase [Litorivivens lipolytica]MBB3045818.1 mannosyl-3-phosphoglycerate phosphatase [Litorivivens lipolytica]
MLVVSDLDGTLLDHHTYSFEPAKQALTELAHRNIPVVLNTSKTRTELVQILSDLQLTTPYIVENGSAIYSADGQQCDVLGKPREVLLKALDQAREQGFSFQSYRDFGLAGVIEHTGLDQAAAEASLAREFTEPLIWKGSAKQRSSFVHWIQAQGLQCLEGGRFLHVMGRCDKGVAMQRLIKTYYPENEGPVVALGDSDNDTAMLARANIAVCIRPASGERLAPATRGTIIHTEAFGPEGWAEALNDILKNR